MADRLSLRAYARHRAERELPGRDHKAVAKAIATGRITEAVGDDGLIDRDLADRLWAERTRTKMELPADGEGPEPEPESTAAPGRLPDDDSLPASLTGRSSKEYARLYAEGRARLTIAKAAQEELDLDERKGALVPLEVHERRLEIVLQRVSAALDALPGSWPPRIAMCKSLDDYQHAVRDLVRELKDELYAMGDTIEADADDDEAESAA